MERRIVNPWKWQDPFGFVQANEIGAVKRTLFCAGQASVDADGRPVHEGDLRAQLEKALENLETVLRGAGLALSDVVRLNYYTTEVDRLLGCMDTLVPRLAAAGCRPVSTLLGVTRLAYPQLLVEIEAIAAA